MNVEAIMTLKQDGLTHKQIAMRLNLTRDQVCGVVFRQRRKARSLGAFHKDPLRANLVIAHCASYFEDHGRLPKRKDIAKSFRLTLGQACGIVERAQRRRELPIMFPRKRLA